ncbi:MAG TPA: ceramidase domain-containing protein [Pyrinomonadaceae bacterium]|nr:ceramidase domain-containing protein [Pyrinomonadaceae bacterium]
MLASEKKLPFWGFITIAIIFFFLPMTILLVMGLSGWPGEYDLKCCGSAKRCAVDKCYCEAITPGIIAQKTSTWSNLIPATLGLVATGLLMLGFPSPGTNPHEKNMIVNDLAFAAVFCGTIIFLGTGSMFFHASMKDWGGWTDNLSMNVFGIFVLLYGILRLVGLPSGELAGLRTDLWLFWGAYLLLNVGLAIFLWNVPDAGTPVFGIIIGSALILEWIIYFRGVFSSTSGRIGGPHLWFWLANGTFLVAFIIWLLSGTDGPLCKDWDIKGHAWWHILCGLAVFFLFLYYRKQERVS